MILVNKKVIFKWWLKTEGNPQQVAKYAPGILLAFGVDSDEHYGSWSTGIIRTAGGALKNIYVNDIVIVESMADRADGYQDKDVNYEQMFIDAQANG